MLMCIGQSCSYTYVCMNLTMFRSLLPKVTIDESPMEIDFAFENYANMFYTIHQPFLVMFIV